MSARIAATVCALTGALAGPVAAAGSEREQFAYALPIEIWAGAPAQWLDLPLTVYRDAVDPALRDLRVLNGKGEVVPFALQRPPQGVARPATELRLPLFPLRGDPVSALAALRLDLRAGSTSLEVRGGAYTPEAPLAAYLIDAQQVGEAFETFVFELLADTADFSVSAVLEASDDLVDWRTVSARVPLARLRHAGGIFENRSVSIRPTRARFWRLSAPPGGTLPVLAGVLGMRVSGIVPVDRQVLTAAGERSGVPGGYGFDLGAQVPVDRLELELPDVNTVAQVEYFARRTTGEPWSFVARAAVHRLQTPADELRSAPLAIPAQACRYWQVVVDPRGGGLGTGVPSLRAGWLAHRVLFVARGAGPFELVYGNFAAQNAEVALDVLLPGGAMSADAVLAQPLARAGTPRLAGGVERLQAPPPAGNWRLGLLWAALGVGVLSLAAVAWRLARQMRDGGQEGGQSGSG